MSDLLVMTEAGDPVLNDYCEVMARLRGTTHAFVVLIYESQFYFIGRYGYIDVRCSIPTESQPDWRGEAQVEYVDPAEEIPGGELYPADLRANSYVHFAPLKLDGIPVGMVGVANRAPMTTATPDQRIALDVMARLTETYLGKHQTLKRHTQEIFGMLQGDT
ncbi:hypothetical protein EV663_10526 [Rhodovulum bhavnagarense]|uniref:GAF domain-containing protein n=1 Tax=Rhodovulum bhavnagarense TaxID=992286 RepID=A0A4R2RFN4_9RHOB|nr:hypothetical protein EV663_10526 [Rhodovulum bhavnagarense]